MSNNQENYGIERSRDYQKVVIQEMIGVKNIKTVREALELAGLSTAQRNYTGAELIDSGFVNIRKLFDQGWTKKQIIEEYLGVQSTSNGKEDLQENDIADDLTTIENALQEGALEVGEALAEATADYLVERFPQLLVQKVKQQNRSGNIRAAFARARSEVHARQLRSADKTTRHQEMLKNFDFSNIRRELKSAAPLEENEKSDNSSDPWENYKLDDTEEKNSENPLEEDSRQL